MALTIIGFKSRILKTKKEDDKINKCIILNFKESRELCIGTMEILAIYFLW